MTRYRSKNPVISERANIVSAFGDPAQDSSKTPNLLCLRALLGFGIVAFHVTALLTAVPFIITHLLGKRWH